MKRGGEIKVGQGEGVVDCLLWRGGERRKGREDAPGNLILLHGIIKEKNMKLLYFPLWVINSGSLCPKSLTPKRRGGEQRENGGRLPIGKGSKHSLIGCGYAER